MTHDILPEELDYLLSHDVASYQLLDDFIDHSLEGGSGVLQSEWHHFVAVDGAASGEGSLVLIWWIHLDLIVNEVSIHEVEESMTCRCVDHPV